MEKIESNKRSASDSMAKPPSSSTRSRPTVKGEQLSYTISGVPVLFPCKPYPTQIQMMSKAGLEYFCACI